MNSRGNMFDRAFKDLMPIEGADKYTDIQGDVPTRWGISEPIARKWGYKGLMKDLPEDVAKAIYKAWFWDVMQLDAIAYLSYPIAFEIFESGVNLGCKEAIEFLQNALNAPLYGQDYSLKVDGVIGDKTLRNLKLFFNAARETFLLKMLNCQQGVRYMQIAAANSEKIKFLEGWFNKRVSL